MKNEMTTTTTTIFAVACAPYDARPVIADRRRRICLCACGECVVVTIIYNPAVIYTYFVVVVIIIIGLGTLIVDP